MPYRHLIANLPTEAACLLRAANELSLARDLQTVTAIVAGAARELTGADGATFVLREGEQCYYADEDAIAPLWKGRRFPLSACISGWVMEYGAHAVIPDIYADDRVLIEAYKPTFVKSMVMVPVRPSDAIAAIGAYWATRHFATDDDVACLRILADSASLALANVQLHAETRAAFEREQQARAAAEHATAAKDEFLALVSHELRQPLHASMAAVRMLTANPDHPETAERARDVIERQIQHMTRLVEDLLDASRIVRGHVTLQLVPIDVRTAVEHVSDIIRPMMEERSHVFTVAVPDSPVFVNADSGRFEQVLMNLLTNAAKYSDPGGRIALSVVVAAGDVVISVRDNGQGIDPAILPRIFDLFTRGAGTASGFGVGLAVVRGLVELHGGTLEARSEGVGRGSEFVVRLPMMDATAVKST